jgi:esterase
MELQYKSYGAGYPLIILHGLFGSLENWQTLSKQFARCYRVLAVDQRNHGASPHASRMDHANMAEDVLEFMEGQHISSAYLLGHSMGGKTAMQFALTHPERVDKLVVVDIAPKAYPSEQKDIVRALLALDLGAARTRKELDTELTSHIRDASLRQFLLKNAIREETGGFKWRIDLRAIDRNLDHLNEAVPAGGKFEKPTLFIKGELSGYIKKADEALIRALFPFSRIVTVPGVGHWVHAEARAQFSRVVLAFLGQM